MQLFVMCRYIYACDICQCVRYRGVMTLLTVSQYAKTCIKQPKSHNFLLKIDLNSPIAMVQLNSVLPAHDSSRLHIHWKTWKL